MRPCSRLFRASRFAPTLVLCAALVACTGDQGIPVVQSETATTSDVVLALRLTPQLSQIERGASDGYVLLVGQNGAAKAVDVGAMGVGKLAWGTDGDLFFGGLNDEFRLGAEEQESVSRGSEELLNMSRFLVDHDHGSVAVYNAGFLEDGYHYRVTVLDDESVVRSWDVISELNAVYQCDDIIVGVTDKSGVLPPGSLTREERQAQTRNRTSFLLKLYPEPSSAHDRVLSEVTADGAFIQASSDSPCADNVTYDLAFHDRHPNWSGVGRFVLRSWNIVTGAHDEVPLRTPAGDAVDITLDDFTDNPGRLVGDEYTWAVRDGRIYTTDVDTGTTRLRFRAHLTDNRSGESQFAFTDAGVVVLDVGQPNAPSYDVSLYDLETGDREHLLTVQDIESVPGGLGAAYITSMALAPDWP